MRFRSLTLRLTFYCIVGLLAAYFTLPATVYLPYTLFRHDETANSTRTAWATGRARKLVLSCLRKNSDGAIYIETTDALRVYQKQNPDLRFAVFDPYNGYVFHGSSMEVAERFSIIISQAYIYDQVFHVIFDTPIGKVGIIVYGSYSSLGRHVCSMVCIPNIDECDFQYPSVFRYFGHCFLGREEEPRAIASERGKNLRDRREFAQRTCVN